MSAGWVFVAISVSAGNLATPALLAARRLQTTQRPKPAAQPAPAEPPPAAVPAWHEQTRRDGGYGCTCGVFLAPTRDPARVAMRAHKADVAAQNGVA